MRDEKTFCRDRQRGCPQRHPGVAPWLAALALWLEAALALWLEAAVALWLEAAAESAVITGFPS